MVVPNSPLKNEARTWTTKDGRTMPISAMGDDHLRNTYRMLCRKGFVSKSTVLFYLSTAGPDGDAAQDCFEQEQRMVFDAPVIAEMDWIESELKRRGISVW